MSPFELNGKTILVTGASSGIGRETAICIAKMGGTLILSGRNKERLSETMAALAGSGHAIIPADLLEEEQIDRLVDEVAQLDGIVHSAGIVRPFPIKFIGKRQIDELYNINYTAPVLLNSKLFKRKKINDEASIVFMSSISSQFPHKGGALYSGAKSALNAYCKVIALEYAAKKIRANYISAAMVKTPLFDEAEKAISKEMMDAHGSHYPLGFGEPEDVAHAVVFLLSSASRWITGTGIVMDGGLTAGQ
jgi:NAD(P)-dependent dehydrogenase (short-subunit alcohol dehydrogenase family)